MAWKDSVYYHLGFFWCLPISILVWVVYLILYFCKQIDSVYWGRDLVMVWDVRNDSWLGRKVFVGRGWGGFAAGCNALVYDTGNDIRWVRTLRHEREHVYQGYKYGVFFPILYILETLRIYFFEKDKNSYYDNRFEIYARVAAGQMPIIPKEKWKDGPTDRWAWW